MFNVVNDIDDVVKDMEMHYMELELRWTGRQTERLINQQTDIVMYRAAFTAKNRYSHEFNLSTPEVEILFNNKQVTHLIDFYLTGNSNFSPPNIPAPTPLIMFDKEPHSNFLAHIFPPISFQRRSTLT